MGSVSDFTIRRLGERCLIPETILVARSEVLVRIGILNGDLVAIVNQGKRCLAHIRSERSLSISNLEAELEISPSIAFILSLNKWNKDNDGCLAISPIESSDTPKASYCTLVRIRSPYSSGFLDYSEQFSEYFKNTVPLSIGQIVSIRLDSNRFIFFQTTSLKTESKEEVQEALIDPSNTRILTEGAINSFAPYFENSLTVAATDHQRALLRIIRPIAASSASKFLDNVFLKVLLIGPRRSCKRILVRNISQQLSMHIAESNSFELVGLTEKDTSQNLKSFIIESCKNAPIIIHLRRLVAFNDQVSAQGRGRAADNSSSAVVGSDSGLDGPANSLRNLFSIIQQSQKIAKLPIVFVASSESFDDIPLSLRAQFTHEIAISPLDTEQRKNVLTKLNFEDGVLEKISKKTAGFEYGDMMTLNAKCVLLHLQRSIQSPQVIAEQDLDIIKDSIAEEALASILDRMTLLHGAKNAEIPSVNWEDVGGLASVKDEILDVIELPIKHSKLFGKSGIKPRAGILLFGPPGTGKTLIAKAIATECSFNFLSVKGPELLNMYVGESESNVRKVFERARAAKPCVLFFDELDSLAPFRGNGSDSGGVMDRIVSQLLTELDGIGSSGSSNELGIPDVLVVGATNRPDLLDPALLRPGRLDRCLYLGISEDKNNQIKIMKALTRKFHLDDSVNFDSIAEKCPRTFTGADFYALCSDAMLSALRRKIDDIDRSILKLKEDPVHHHLTTNQFIDSMMTPEERLVVVSQVDFLSSLPGLTPSVSEKEIEHYEKLRAQFSTVT